MKYLFEGPDNAGKSTLARTIQDESYVAVSYNHPGGPPADVDTEAKCLEDQYFLLSKYNHVILDRATCISQQVYNPDPILEPVRRLNLLRLLSIPDLVLIYCRPSDDRLMRTQDLTWREGETEEHKQKIIKNQHLFIKRYDAILTPLPHVLFDYEASDAEMIRNMLISTMNGSRASKMFLEDLINRKRKP